MALHGLPPVLQGAEPPVLRWSADAKAKRGSSREKNRREKRVVHGDATISGFDALFRSRVLCAPPVAPPSATSKKHMSVHVDGRMHVLYVVELMRIRMFRYLLRLSHILVSVRTLSFYNTHGALIRMNAGTLDWSMQSKC